MGDNVKIKVELPELVNKALGKPVETLEDKLSDLFVRNCIWQHYIFERKTCV